MVKKNSYDLVPMDIEMPEMDGMQATQLIRRLQDPFKASIPIVALTANALKGDSEKYIAAGMSDYLSKPFDESKLFLVISQNIKTGSLSQKSSNMHEQPTVPAGEGPQKLYDLS